MTINKRKARQVVVGGGGTIPLWLHISMHVDVGELGENICLGDAWLKDALGSRSPKALMNDAARQHHEFSSAAGITSVAVCAPAQPRGMRAGQLQIRELPDVYQPMTFDFPAGDGEHTIKVHLDDFGHASKERRAYSTCPYGSHHDCHKYTKMNAWPEAWMSVAYVLCYVRQGALVDGKPAHRRQPDPTDVDVQNVQDEMPAILFGVFPTTLAR